MTPNGRRTVLVTNDDGLSSPGLRVLADAARTHDLDVTVIAPRYDASGASAALTAVAHDHRVSLDPAPGPWPDGVEAFGVDAPPAFIVRSAMYGAFGDPPDLVLSGVNRGTNAGRAVLHSGTVGAALTAATHGRRALAISVEASAPGQLQDWSTAADVCQRAVGWLLALETETVLNVNVPDLPPELLRGVRKARLASLGVVQSTVSEVTAGSVPVTFCDELERLEPGTDRAALQDGYVSVTAVSPLCEDWRVQLDSVLPGHRFAWARHGEDARHD